MPTKRTVQVNGRTIEWEKGLTVSKILENFDLEFRQFVVKVDGEIVKKDSYKSRPVSAGAKISIIPLLSGG